MKKILAIVLALFVVLSMTACTNSAMKATETENSIVAVEDPVKSEFIAEFDEDVKEIFGDDLIFTMYENGIYSIVITAEGIDDIYSYYHKIPTELSDYIVEMSNAIYEAGLDNMMVLVSDVDNGELLIIYNGTDVTEVVLNAD